MSFFFPYSVNHWFNFVKRSKVQSSPCPVFTSHLTTAMWIDQRQSKKMTNQLNVATLSGSKRGKTSLTVQCKHNVVSKDLHFTCLFVHSQNLRFVVSVHLHHTRSASCPLLNLLCSCHQIPSGFLPVRLDCLVFLRHLFF